MRAVLEARRDILLAPAFHVIVFAQDGGLERLDIALGRLEARIGTGFHRTIERSVDDFVEHDHLVEPVGAMP